MTVSGVGGQSHRGGQRKIALRRRATDVAAAVEVQGGAIGAPDLWLQRDGGDIPSSPVPRITAWSSDEPSSKLVLSESPRAAPALR